LAAGFRVTVYNRSPGRASELGRRGGDVGAAPGEGAERADVVCGFLLDSAAVEDVYESANGLLSRSRAGQVYVEHATFAPELARSIANRLEQRGAAFLDAPVTGGPEAASSGRLT